MTFDPWPADVAVVHCGPMENAEELVRRAAEPGRVALALHPFYRGKVQMMPKCPVRGAGDLAVWYTPGVAAPCRAIAADPEAVYEHTNRANTVAVVSDGTRVLGLGDIGPRAGLPVMEGKALLFKYFGGVDAVPLCLDTRDEDELVRTVEVLAPSFGGINLEDIAAPKCFRVLDRLRDRLEIPVWHDDEQGTATVLLAALENALEVVGKHLDTVRVTLVGYGAANVSVHRLLAAAGVDPAAVVICDRGGTLHPGRRDIERAGADLSHKWRACLETNADGVVGGVAEALHGADVCIAFAGSGPGVIHPSWVEKMQRDAVVFACANPVPEIWPWEATAAGAAVVATGRSDLANQVNNSLGFPGIFRGVLDVRARTITDGMALAAARELARYGRTRAAFGPAQLLPTMDDWEVHPTVAVATAAEARREGLARVALDDHAVRARARTAIEGARRATQVLMDTGVIPPVPPPPG